MKTKPLLTWLILCFIIVFSQQNVINASSTRMLKKFTFYGIGVGDTKETVANKLNTNGFQCGEGKASDVGIRNVIELRGEHKPTELIGKLLAIDKDLKDHGQGLAIKDMPVDVIGCSSIVNSPFTFSEYFFSKFDGNIVAIDIGIEKINIVKEKLTSKFGSCVSEGYCESDNSVLILTQKRGWSLHVYFFENLKLHHNKIKGLKDLRDKKVKEKIDEAF